jgi:hypothetical protein
MKRAELKRQIRTGELTVAQVLNQHPEDVETMLLSDLVRAQMRWGEGRTRKLLGMVQLPFMKRCGSLTNRQRDVVCQYLEGQL